MVSLMTDLTPEHAEQVLPLMKATNTLFQGQVGVYNSEPIHLELTKDYKPFHTKAYTVLHSLQDVLKKELS
jgi:hypothetical protein